MSEYRPLLERARETFPPLELDVEQVFDRRDRKQRNRRIRAGVVGVVVALAAGFVLVRSLTSEEMPATPPVDAPPAPVAVGTLAYILDNDVYVADADGSNAVKILDGLPDAECGSTDGYSYGGEGSMWSPDGRYLAFNRVDCSGGAQDSMDVVISDASGNVLAAFPYQGWGVGWSPDSSRVAVWDTTFETVGVYGIDGVRIAQIEVPDGWGPSGDHDPAWLADGTLAIDDVELPLDGSPARRLDFDRANEWMDDYYAALGRFVPSPDGSLTAITNGRQLLVEDSGGTAASRVSLLRADRKTYPWVLGWSPGGDRIFYMNDGLWSIGVDGSDPVLLVAGTNRGDWFVPTAGDTTSEPSVEP